MPIDHSSVGYRRLPGLYNSLIEQQQAAVVKIDLRVLDWSLTDPEEIAADRAAITAEAKAHPQRSTLLDKLLDSESVIVGWSMLHSRLPADRPEWLSDPRITACVRVCCDESIESAAGPADQCGW
ncbi:MAG: hypothetical protein ACLP9Y_22765 [Mycobacterium sp.]